MPNTSPISRFDFPYPSETTANLRKAILALMIDGIPRSILEIQDAIGTRKEIGARIRELRNGIYGARWPFNDSRSSGPDADGVFRYRLDIAAVRREQTEKCKAQS